MCAIIADRLHLTIVDDLEQLKNFLPILIFVGAYVLTDIYIATAALMIAVTIQVGALWLAKKPISMELKGTFWVGLVMGSLTLILQDERFIQWKTSIVNTVLACALIFTHFKGRSYGTEIVLKKMLQSQELALDGNKANWRTINIIWILSFLVAAGLNLVVAYNFSLDFWVTYKLVGGMVITFTTVVLTMVYMYNTGMISEPEEPNPAADTSNTTPQPNGDGAVITGADKP